MPHQPPAVAPRCAQLWSDVSRDFNGLRRQRAIEGSVDGHPRLFMTPGDAMRFNILSKRWNKWLGILAEEEEREVEALAFLAAANQQSIDLRLGMAWNGLAAIAAVLALQKLDMGLLLGAAVRDLASQGAVGGAAIFALWICFVSVATYMLLNQLWRINAAELRACVDLALLRRRADERPPHILAPQQGAAAGTTPSSSPRHLPGAAGNANGGTAASSLPGARPE